ncbi:MAG: hypothetical protein WCL50_07255 [Spirochaetota bacterium]
MSSEGQKLEDRVEELSTRVLSLETQLEKLKTRLSDFIDLEEKTTEGRDGTVSEDALSWAGRASILPRIATICFLLVVALVLRTITDVNVVPRLTGQWLGMGYAAAIMVAGWFLYGGKSPLAPVFAACGAILLGTVVVETRMHFQSLMIAPAYLTLLATGILMALMSLRFNAFIPISVGVIVMCVAGAALDWPKPNFAYLSMLLFTANLLGFFAAKLKRCTWLRWSVMAVTMLMLLVGGTMMGLASVGGSEQPSGVSLFWYLAVITGFFVTFLVLSLIGILRRQTEKHSRFALSLPPINAAWAFVAALLVLSAEKSDLVGLGILGIVIALAHLVAAFVFARRGAADSPVTSTFALAGTLLLGLSLPFASGSYTLTLPLLSLVALLLFQKSRDWNNGGIRAISYTAQSYTVGGLFLFYMIGGFSPGDAILMLPTFLLALLLVLEYALARRNPVPVESKLFESVDPKDRGVVLLLLAGLVSAFLMIRTGMGQVFPKDLNAFSCSQSVFINATAIVLIALAWLRHNREIRGVAILVTVVGGFKVFLDMVGGGNGLPLVFSVLSFGILAAVESIVLGRWAKDNSGKAGK